MTAKKKKIYLGTNTKMYKTIAQTVDFVTDLAEDLRRRDFTINAMALRSKTDIVDLFGGQDDLAAHIVRAVGVAEERFAEDALRMLRAVRFSAKLNFDVEQQTLQIYALLPLSALKRSLIKLFVVDSHIELFSYLLIQGSLHIYRVHFKQLSSGAALKHKIH